MNRRRSPPLWMLLAPVLLLVVLIGVQGARFVVQREAITRIEALGGRVQTTQGGPDWLRRLAGRRLMRVLDRATVVNLSNTPTTDADLRALNRLRGVERLNLAGTKVSDAGMTTIEQLSGLKALDLNGTSISDAGLTSLATLTKLEFLYLDGTRVSAAGIRSLSGLRALKHVTAAGSNATPALARPRSPEAPQAESPSQ